MSAKAWNDPAITTEEIIEIMEKTYQPKIIYLCKPDSKVNIALNGIETDTVELSQHIRDYWTLEFDVKRWKIMDGHPIFADSHYEESNQYDTFYDESNGYEMLHNHMELLIPGIGYFQMHEPELHNDGKEDEYKHVLAYSCDKEFEDKDYIGLKINTGETDSMEYLATDNVDDLGFAKQYVTFYNPNNPELSLMHIVLSKVPSWTVDDEDIDVNLWPLRMQFNEDSVNMWGFLNSTVAPKADCIFVFDILNRHLKAYSKQKLNSNRYFDTNIFIGLRNLEKQVNVTVDENSIYTRFNVYGSDELDIRQVNYGESRIFDISWYLNENYMSQELIDKTKAWIKWREDHINQFAGCQKDMARLKEWMDELMYRVPADEDYWKQWDEMGEDQLFENLQYHSAVLQMLQQSVEALDDQGNPIQIVDEHGNIDHAAYLQLLYEKENGFGGYYTYLETYQYVIPNILTAIENLSKIPEKKKKYNEGYETNWKLYGIQELINRRATLETEMDALRNYSRDWSELTVAERSSYSDSERQYGVAGHDRYVELYNLIGYVTEDGETYIDIFTDGDTELLPPVGSLNRTLYDLRTDYSSIELMYNNDKEEAAELVEMASIDNPIWEFTEADKYVLNKLMIDTDYSNDNIVITSLDTGETRVDLSKQLYDDAVNKLSEASQPQFKFTVDLENFLELVQFTDWIKDLKLLNFIRLGIRDDFVVKMRVIGITFNPCEKSPELRLEFSNMINGRTGRSDIYDLLDTMASPSKNSFTLTSNTKIDQDFASNLLRTMIQTQMFTNKVNDVIAANTITANTAQISSIVSDIVSTSYIEADKIKGTQAEFEQLFSQYVNAEFITAEILRASQGTFQELTTQILHFAEDSIIDIAGQQITPQSIINALTKATPQDFTNLDGESAFIKNILTVGEDGITQLTRDTIRTSRIDADQINVTSAFVSDILTVGEDGITQLTRNTISTSTINADQINVTDAFVRDILTVGEDGITQLTKDAIKTSRIDADQINVTNAFVSDVLTIGEEGITQLTRDAISTSTINADQINVTDAFVRDVLTIGEDGITQLTKDTIKTSRIDADQINVTNAFVSDILTVGEDGITQLTRDTISTSTINADQINVTDAFVRDVLTIGEDGITQLTKDTIKTSKIDADQINVTDAFVDGVLRVGTDKITEIADGVITTEKVVTQLIEADQGDFIDLTSDSAFIRNVLRVGESGITEIANDTITTDTVITRLLEAEELDVERLTSDTAFIKYLESILVIASEIQVDDLKAKLATIDVANIEQLYANNAFVRSLQTLSSTSATSVINDAYIYNAVANKIAVADLKAGDITISNGMRIVSDNGNLIMNGSALQILGEDSSGDPYVGVQLGYATNGTPSLILRNEDGATILSPSGITADAIADELIIDDMIKDGTISEDKLGFSVMKQGDTIAIEKVTTGGGSFGVEYTAFKNGTNSALADLAADMDSLSYQLYIETPNGKYLRGGNITLSAKLYKNYVDVTDDYDASCFTWVRHSRDASADAYWNANHTTGTKTLVLTGNDIVMEADFECIFEEPDDSENNGGE